MENGIKRMEEKVNGMKGRVGERVDWVGGRVRVKVVVVMLGLFGVCRV